MLVYIIMDTKLETKNQGLKEEEKMYRAGVHFGYSRASRHPQMDPTYFHSFRNGVEIFNLEKVYLCLEKASSFLSELGSKKAIILIVSTKSESKETVEKVASEFSMPCVTERWIGGTLTNFNQIKKRINDFDDLYNKKKEGFFSDYSKKELSRLDKKLVKLEKQFGGLLFLKQLPAALLIVDPKEESAAVEEAKVLGIPIVAILNSDCNPSGIDYVIPANDASFSSIQFLLKKLAEGYKMGMKNVKIEE